MKRYLVKTKDYSHTLFVPELDEHYHSIHGALQESLHVFIEAGLKSKSQLSEISILEIGFGTGLNALLSLLEAQKLGLKINYYGIEKYPLTSEEWQTLKYADVLNSPSAQASFELLHQAEWNNWINLSDNFDLFKDGGDLRAFKAKENAFDLVYFDAFAPSAQDYLWSIEVFKNIYNSLRQEGSLVTYCAKGWVRRNMQAAGFRVEKLPGPPGKREMVRAHKD